MCVCVCLRVVVCLFVCLFVCCTYMHVCYIYIHERMHVRTAKEYCRAGFRFEVLGLEFV